MVAKLALEYGWTKQEILDQVLPEEVGPLLEAAYRRRAAMNLDMLSIACAPYYEKEARERLFEFWSRAVNPPKEDLPFDPSTLLRANLLGGVGVSPALVKELEEMERRRNASSRPKTP